MIVCHPIPLALQQVEDVRYFEGKDKEEWPFAVVTLRSLEKEDETAEGQAPVGEIFHLTLHCGHSLPELMVDSRVFQRLICPRLVDPGSQSDRTGRSLRPWKEGEKVST
eukprot:757758-Hanusia_phi.AAC.2